MITFDEYQLLAESTAVFEHEYYPHASLMIEAAELADILCKPVLRGDPVIPDRERIKKEAGDVLWNLAVICKRSGFKLSEVAEANVEKLRKRKENGTIMGSGDER